MVDAAEMAISWHQASRLLGVVSVSVWEAIFMLVVLKLPLVYLAVVLWWAIRAEPRPAGGSDEVGVLSPLTPCGWDEWRRRQSVRPGSRPNRPSGRVALAPRARAV